MENKKQQIGKQLVIVVSLFSKERRNKMARVSEEISKANSTSQGKTDANLANDSNHLGGIPADEYATKAYVQEYHNTKESALKEYIQTKKQTK